ncbi:MAG TPA: hypothetical protein VNA28_12830, partial [Solirubrobacteraceae bacterium]|nr:hypothetical protein [Solirubrobacteraceae bacterium]
LEALSDALRTEVAPFGVRVILVEPGSFGSNIWDSGHAQAKQRTDVYAEAYRRAETAAAHADKLPDVVWVARAIRLALANPVPLARYLVGFDAMVGTALESLAPTSLADFVKGASVGLRKLPFRK